MELKSEEVKQVHDGFVSNLKPILVDFYKQRIKEQQTLVKLIERRYIKMRDSIELAGDLTEKVEIQRTFKEGIFELLNKQKEMLIENGLNGLNLEFENAVKKNLEGTKRLIHIKELFHGYPIRINENPIKSVRKIFVNLNRYLIITLKRIANVFLMIFRKKQVDPQVYRRRRVPLKNLAKYFILVKFLEASSHLYTKLKERQSKGIIALWEVDEKLDQEFHETLSHKEKEGDNETKAKENYLDIFKSLSSEYQSLVIAITLEIDTISNDTFIAFDQALQVVDSLDLPSKNFRESKWDNERKDILRFAKKEQEKWQNTHAALFDDWAVDVEITLLYYSVFDEFNYLQENIDKYIKGSISGSFKKIKNYLTKIHKEIVENASSKKSLLEAIAVERRSVSNQLIDKLLTQTIESLTGCFTKDFDTLKSDTLKLVEKVSTSRGFIKNKNYLKGVNVSEVKFISPRELLNFEALPVFEARVEEIERWVDMQLEKARINLMRLGTVCDFTLESAQIMLQQNKGTSKNAVESVVDGFDRALVHLEKVVSILSKIQDTIEKDLSEAINTFDHNILKLKNTENIFELNLKIARIKAVERTEEFKERLLSNIRMAIPKVKEQIGSVRSKFSAKIKELKLRIGIAEQKKYVYFELSEFIDQTQESLKKLPFVYQRLYQLSPTDEERFYVNRERELRVLKKSLENWKKDRFITVAIIGEKGSGITSLINYFLKKSEVDIPVIKHTLDCKIYNSEAYFHLFSDLLGAEKFESNDQIINFINHSNESRVIVLENLQHMFLKQVNGFDCMNMFFELMANTMKKVLWIGAYTSHSWQYLDKAIHISNYFTNEIYVDPMDKYTIQEIIYKRNSLSGFQIVFKPNDINIESKTYQKMGEKERQTFLKEQFFLGLRQMSSGNISLAQLYWLQSTQLASDDEIHLSPISEFDFSFVKNLYIDDLFTMQALIIHDGLELDDFAKVMGKSISFARNILTPMLEKGLLIRPKNKYNINPIIFRPVANYLASRNFVN